MKYENIDQSGVFLLFPETTGTTFVFEPAPFSVFKMEGRVQRIDREWLRGVLTSETAGRDHLSTAVVKAIAPVIRHAVDHLEVLINGAELKSSGPGMIHVLVRPRASPDDEPKRAFLVWVSAHALRSPTGGDEMAYLKVIRFGGQFSYAVCCLAAS